ncbi:MAG: hypothetical protein V4850_06395 [Myxococcota bacterium]
MSLLVALVSLALATGGPGDIPAGPPSGASVGAPSGAPPNVGSTAKNTPAPGDQRVTVYFRGAPAGVRVQAQRGEDAPTPMADSGTGVLSADLYGPPARFLQLRLLLQPQNGAAYPVYDGLVVLTDPAHETLAFQFQDQQALRLPVAPSARTEVALDQRTTWWVSFAWGALSLAWVGLLGVLWALRSR